MKQESKQDIVLRLREALNAQQRSVPQLPAQARAKKISVLGAKTDPQHPFAGYAVGADEAAEPGHKVKSPDQNDPYEKGWRAGFRHDESNPYPAGSKQAAQWDRGYAEAEAQPDHYDEEVDLSEKLGALRPKLGTGHDVGKSVRKWRKQRGLSESDTQDKTDSNFFRKFSNLIAEAEQQVTEVTRRGFLKSLAGFAASVAVPAPVVKLLSTPAGVLILSTTDGIALLKSIQDHLDQWDAEDDDDYYEAWEDMADELGFESTDNEDNYHDPVGDLLNLYRKNPEQAAQQLIKHIQSKAITPTDVKASFTSRANDPGDWRYQARKDREKDIDNNVGTSTTSKSEPAAGPTTGMSGLARAAGAQIGRTMKNVGRGTADTILNQPARDMGRIEPTTAPAALPAPAARPGMQIPKQKSRVAASPFNNDHREIDQFVKEEWNRDRRGNWDGTWEVEMGVKPFYKAKIKAPTADFAVDKLRKRGVSGIKDATDDELNVRPGERNELDEVDTAKTYESRLGEAKKRLAEGTITKTPTGIKHTGTYGTDAHDPYKSWNRPKTRGRPTKSKYVGRDVDIDEPKKRYGAPSLGVEIGPGATPTRSSPVVSRSHVSATSPIASTGLAFDLPQHVQDKIYAQSDFDRAKKNPGTIGRTKKPNGEVPMLDLDEAESRFVLYLNGKPQTHHATREEAEKFADTVRAKMPDVKIEIKNEVREQGVAEGVTPETIHKLADRKGVKWDNEPDFLQLTKRLTGKEHLDDLDPAGLQKVKRHLDGLPGVTEGARVDRMVKHIASSEKSAGKSKKDAESIAWATVNKRGYLDNKNKKKGVKEMKTPADIRAKNRAVVKKIQGKETDIDEGWKQKVASAALAGAAALGGGAAVAGSQSPNLGIDQFNQPTAVQTAPGSGVPGFSNTSGIDQFMKGADLQTTPKAGSMHVDDRDWDTAGYDDHIKSDTKLTKTTTPDGQVKRDSQGRISSVQGPNAQGEYRVFVGQNGKIVSSYVTKTPPQNWMVKEDIDEGWKSKLAGAALAGAAALGGGAQAQTAPATGVNATGNNAAIVQSLVNPVAQQRFAAQHADTTAKLTDPKYTHNPDALAQHQAAPKQTHAEWIENVKNAAEFNNPYQIIRIALNMAGVTPKEVLQNLPKGYKLPTTEPKTAPVRLPGDPGYVREGVTKEDIITKLKAKLGDYLSDIGQEIRKDPDLINKLAAKPAGNQMGPPVKTITTDDGHEIQIHGNEDDGFRISIKNRQTPSQFKNLDEAVMACEMYCGHRRRQALNADYVEEA